MGETTVTPTQAAQAAPATLANNGTPVETPTTTVPQLQEVKGPNGETTISLPGGITATVKGYDPASRHFILTCADTAEHRAPYPGAAYNHRRVLQTRANHPTIENAVQHYRNETGELTITVPSKSGDWNGLKKASRSAKSAVGQLHIVNQNKPTPEATRPPEEEKDKAWYDPTGWKFWAIVLGTLGVAALAYFGFRKGGWFRSKKKKTSTSKPTVAPIPSEVPGLEDDWGPGKDNPGQDNPGTDNPGNTPPPVTNPTPSTKPEESTENIGTPADTITNIGGVTIIQGGPAPTVLPGESITADCNDAVSGPSIRSTSR